MTESYPAWMKDLSEKERKEAIELRRKAFPHLYENDQESK